MYTPSSHVNLLTGSYENVHRRMAGKLCGPSSSKASSASTPIPLGIAKNTRYVEKRKPSRARNTIHTCTHDTYRHIIIYMQNKNTYTHLIQRKHWKCARACWLTAHICTRIWENSCDTRKEISCVSAALLSAKKFDVRIDRKEGKVPARDETGKTRKHRTEKGKREKSMHARDGAEYLSGLPEHQGPPQPSSDVLSFFCSSISSTKTTTTTSSSSSLYW